MIINNNGVKVIAGMRRISQRGPLSGCRIKHIQPGDKTTHMAAVITANKINKPVVHYHATAPALPLRRDLWPGLPGISSRVVNQYIGKRFFFRETTG